MAVRQCFQWTRAARGYIAGSRWEQTLVFPDGQRYFFASDRVTTVNDCECLLLRTDLPGHLKHDRGDCFTSIYLSHVGEISSDRFLYDFPPDGDFLYRRAERAIQEHLIRAYRLRVGAEAGPWLGGITIDPADVYEAWCHQRGYVCFIQEIGGRKIRRDESFGADYAIGYFDSVEEMVVLARRLKGLKGLKVAGETESARWGWTEHGGG
ncbi:MAG: hypothetical protein HYU43_03630 [Armatimonadetes bacterium]|nr:hypothetical protein [Armatimonadota bacterium]